MRTGRAFPSRRALSRRIVNPDILSRSASDAFSVADSAAPGTAYTSWPQAETGLLLLFTVQAAVSRTTSDTVTFADAASPAAAQSRTTSDSFSFSDDAAGITGRSAADSFAFTATATPHLVFARTSTASFTVSDFAALLNSTPDPLGTVAITQALRASCTLTESAPTVTLTHSA